METEESTIPGLTGTQNIKLFKLFDSLPHLEQVILYGSRALGRYHSGSDIDLVFEGRDLDFSSLIEIERKIDDLLLPHQFDIALLNRIENPDLLEHIERVGVVVFSRTI